MILKETKEFLEKECISNCGHNANENCICKIALCFKEIEKAQNIIEILKKHFIISFKIDTELNGNVWARFVDIQAKEDEGEWDCCATANLVKYKEDFDVLKECFSNEQIK